MIMPWHLPEQFLVGASSYMHYPLIVTLNGFYISKWIFFLFHILSGVHYPMDNLSGLNLGTLILNEKLPKHLATSYGYDEELMKTRLEALSFDWGTFDPYECTIDGVPVGELLLL